MPSDEILRRFFKVSAVGYALTALRAIFDQKGFESSIAVLDREDELDRAFWSVLGASYLVTIAAAAWVAGKDRVAAKDLAPPLMAAKGASTALFTVQYLKTRRPSYLVSAITDGGLLGATVWLWQRSKGRHLRAVIEDNVTELQA